MPTSQQLLRSALLLESALERRHLDRGLLRGPDPGVRFNLRAWRFLKSALDFYPWGDDYVFTQTQAYWSLANWMLHGATGDEHYRQNALVCAEAVLRMETPEGAWKYPLPERKHLIATLESMMAASVLLAAYAREARPEFLDGAVRAADFIANRIGFQAHDGGEAINYFDRPRGKVPNNSVIAAWFFLHMHAATGDKRFLDHAPSLVRFVESVQLPTGEIPYVVGGPNEKARPHYLCYQYDAFQFLYMAWANRLAPDTWKREALGRLAGFLQGGVRQNGACASNCDCRTSGGPETDYYTAALGAALYEAWRLGLWPDEESAQKCFDRVLSRQRPDGGFGFSSGDYRILKDSRSYPRQQAMTLFHLLYACGLGDGFSRGEG
ncbi:MAG: hypothetical protein KGM47_18310, partial [Acidobacteriota bacterium]|nr:hypothetical protein [Acidobacteriota bacterium]